MSDEILRSGDQAIYNPTFGPAMVTVSPGTLTGTGAQVNAVKARVCVQGDQASATVPGCAYVSGPFVTPGTGTLSISALGVDQLSRKSRSGGKPLMLRGTTSTAKFEVISPATKPGPEGPVPDPTLTYTGSGSFRTGNMGVRDRG
jgi:hypothetical protein